MKLYDKVVDFYQEVLYGYKLGDYFEYLHDLVDIFSVRWYFLPFLIIVGLLYLLSITLFFIFPTAIMFSILPYLTWIFYFSVPAQLLFINFFLNLSAKQTKYTLRFYFHIVFSSLALPISFDGILYDLYMSLNDNMLRVYDMVYLKNTILISFIVFNTLYVLLNLVLVYYLFKDKIYEDDKKSSFN